MLFSPSGVAAYGACAVDGSVPAPLSGRTVGVTSWRSDTRLIYSDGGTGSGPWVLNQLQYPGLTTSTLDADGANKTASGGNVWARWFAGEGVTTSWGGLFATAGLATVSPAGETVLIDDMTSGAGLTIYDSLGSVIYTIPDVIVANQATVRLRDSILSYSDKNGWHLVNISTGLIPNWYPRIDGVTQLVPVTFNGVLFVIEAADTVSLRMADRPEGWVIRSVPPAYGLDAVALTSVIRAGCCLDSAESDDSLMTFDVTVSNAASVSVVDGTISGGGIVYAPSRSVDAATFSVGAAEGRNLTTAPQSPYPQKVTEPNGLMSRPWLLWAQAIDKKLVSLGGVVQNTPNTPIVTPGAGFTQVASLDQPTLTATAGHQTINFDSSDDSVEFALNPSTNTVDLTVRGGGVCYVPVSTGAEPLVIVSNGEGSVLLTPYTP